MVAIEHRGRSPLQRKALLLISDGGDNASRHTLGQVISMADQSGAAIFTIGAFDEDGRRQKSGRIEAPRNSHRGTIFLFPQNFPICLKSARK